MSGIFGAWHVGGLSLNLPNLQRCFARLASAPCPQSFVSPDPSSFFGSSSGQLLASGDRVVVFEGRLDDRATLRRTLGEHRQLPVDAPDVSFVMAAYEEFGQEFIEHIDGDFALAVFDGPARRLVVARDRMGLRPLCYVRLGETLLFASDAKALLAYPNVTAEPDEAMLADFVLYFLAADDPGRTFFKNICSLPPAHLLVGSRNGVAVRRYFDFDTNRSVRLGGVREYAAAFDQLFTASVRHRLRSRDAVAVSVSGGLDSSYIFCTAQRLQREEPGLCPAIIGFNYGGSDGTSSNERTFLEALENRCGARIERLSPQAGFMAGAADEVRHTESPNVEVHGRLIHSMLAAVRDSGARRLLTGHWGDQMLLDSAYLVDLLRAGRLPTLRKHCKGWRVTTRQLAMRFTRDLLDHHAPQRIKSWLGRARRLGDPAWEHPWYTPRFRRVLRDRVAAPRLARPGGATHAWAIYRQARLRYHLQCMEWNNRVGGMHGVDVAFPYLDRHLIQFLMSIPGDVQSQDGVSRGLMREAMKGTVPDVIIHRRSKGEFTYLSNESVELEFSEIRGLLGADALAVRLGYVDGPALWSRLEDWRSAMRRADDAVLSDRIVNLCGFELLLRTFFADAGAA